MRHSTLTEREALRLINSAIEYLWNDEEADFLATCTREKNKHVFPSLTQIRRWMLDKKKMLDNSFHTVARSANKILPIR